MEERRVESGKRPDGAGVASGQDLLRQGIAAYESEHDSDRALELFEAAMDAALSGGDRELRDRAFCNHASVRMGQGDENASVRELRDILMRTAQPETACLAAYNIGVAYKFRGALEKARFYYKVAEENVAPRDGQSAPAARKWTAAIQNELGNLYLIDSRFDDAAAAFERSLELTDDERSVARALMHDNLGYCRFIEGRMSEGFALVFEALRTLQRLGAKAFEAYPRLSLAYGYLEVGKVASSLRHGARVLALADEFEDDRCTKHALFLLGEAYHQLGDYDEALNQFTVLQDRYFPESEQLPEILMAIDVSKMINLKA